MRPRKRLIQRGPQALSDAELLAVFLRVGVTGKSAVDLGRDMVKHFGSLQALFAATVRDFSSLHGLGTAKYAQLQAVLELARRVLSEELRSGKAHEAFVVLFLDVKNCLIAAEELTRGTISHANVYPREVVKAALTHNASTLILAHNHPSGEVEPSKADLHLTKRLQQALALVDMTILDHIVPAVTGKGPMVGNNVSHANNKTKRRFLPNLQNRRIFVESENRWVSLRLSNAGLRVIDKIGIDAVLVDMRARGEK
eukprot:gene24262-26005_t